MGKKIFGVQCAALRSASSADGGGGPLSWWRAVAEATLQDCNASDLVEKFSYDALLTQELASALELYKDGGAPTPEKLVKLKRRLLCVLRAFFVLRNKEREP